MSKTIKVILGIVILIVSIGLIVSLSSSVNKGNETTSTEQSATTTAVQNIDTVPLGITGLGLSAQNDTSSASLQSDVSAIDLQLNTLSVDATALDQALLAQ